MTTNHGLTLKGVAETKNDPSDCTSGTSGTTSFLPSNCSALFVRVLLEILYTLILLLSPNSEGTALFLTFFFTPPT